jgi:hypothetical protein
MGVLTFPNYDIGRGRLVCLIGLAAPAPPSTFRQLGRNPVPLAIRVAGLPANGVRPAPGVRVDGRQFGHQSVAVLGGASPPAHALVQFRISMPEAGGFLSAESLAQRRIIVGKLGCSWRGSVRRPGGRLPRRSARLLGTRATASAFTGIAWIGARLPRRLRIVAQQAVPVERQVGVRVFQRLAHLRVQGASPNLDM